MLKSDRKFEIVCPNEVLRSMVLEKLESQGVVWIGGDKATDDPVTQDRLVVLSIGDWELRGDERIAYKFVVNHDRVNKRVTAVDFLFEGDDNV